MAEESLEVGEAEFKQAAEVDKLEDCIRQLCSICAA